MKTQVVKRKPIRVGRISKKSLEALTNLGYVVILSGWGEAK